MVDLPAFNDGPVVGTFTPLAPGSSEVNGPGTLASVDQFLVGAQAELTAAATSVQQIGEQVEARADEAISEIQDALGAYALTVPPGFPYAPPGAPVTFPEGFAA